MNRYNQQSRNRSSNDLGKNLEDLILKACIYYRMKGMAEIDRTPEPFRVKKIAKDGTFTGRFIGLAQPDFQGTLNGGQSIVFEAKATRTDKLVRTVLTNEQKERLDFHHQLGAISGVCCSVKKTYAFVPWEDWLKMKELFGHQHLTEADLKKYEVPTPGYIDFLGGRLKELIKC